MKISVTEKEKKGYMILLEIKQINKEFYSILGNMCKLILFFLGVFITKNKTIWIFGESGGMQFLSNSKYLFIYILKYQKMIRPIWFTKKRDIVKEINNLGGEAYLFNSLKALYFGLIAKVYIHSYGRDDILNYSIKNAIFVNLYHGMVIKKLKKYYRKDDLDIASSELFIQVRRDIFPKIKKIAITGEPRYDIFFSKVDKVGILKKYHLERYIGKKIISYLPTHRNYRNKYKAIFQNFNEIIKFQDVVFFDKSHPMEKNMARDEVRNFNNVVNISDLYIDTQELLSVTDILITDYSSCFIDFLLTERPVIFYAYDLKEFTEKNGFYVDYKKNVPGKICYNESELYNCIQAYLKYPELDYRKRIQGKRRFHKYYDGNSSERVYQEIMKLLDK